MFKSKENTKYWLDKIRNETSSMAHVQGAKYFRDVVMAEIDVVRKAEEESQEQNGDDQVQNVDTQHQPWILENRVNATLPLSKLLQQRETTC